MATPITTRSGSWCRTAATSGADTVQIIYTCGRDAALGVAPGIIDGGGADAADAGAGS